MNKAVIDMLKADGFQQRDGFPNQWVADWDDQVEFYIPEGKGGIEMWYSEEKVWISVTPEWVMEWVNQF